MGGQKIAILDDGTTWGAGVASGVRRRLYDSGVIAAVDETITPGEEEYSALALKMQAAGVEVFFLGGYHREAGLIFRQAHDRGHDLQLIANSAMAREDFPMIAGPGLEVTVMVAMTDTRALRGGRRRDAVSRAGSRVAGNYVLRLCRGSGLGSGGGGGGPAGLEAVIDVLHSCQFDTVLGRIGFDEKGGITGFEPWQWHVWQEDGTYVPPERRRRPGIG